MPLNLYEYDLSYNDWAALIEQYIFNERDRKILKRRLLDGLIFEDLAEEFDLSVPQIKNIVYKASGRLSKHLK